MENFIFCPVPDASPVERLLQGLTLENFWKFYIFLGESSSPHRGTKTGCNNASLCLGHIAFRITVSVLETICRGGSRAAATSRMERFVIIVNGWKLLTIITKRSILGVAAALNSQLIWAITWVSLTNCSNPYAWNGETLLLRAKINLKQYCYMHLSRIDPLSIFGLYLFLQLFFHLAHVNWINYIIYYCY